MIPVDEYGALIHAGRWGIHGASLPGRVTFAPGNVGFATFGAPRPMEVSLYIFSTFLHLLVVILMAAVFFLFLWCADSNC